MVFVQSGNKGMRQTATFIDVRVEVAVFLSVCSSLVVVLINEDAHLGQQLHLLLIQVICGYLRHSNGRLQVPCSTVVQKRKRQQVVKTAVQFKY